MKKPRLTSLYQVRALVKDHHGKLSFSLILGVASACFSLVPFFIVYLMAEQFFVKGFDQEIFVFYALCALISLFIRYLLYFVSTMLAHAAAFKINYGLKSAVIAHIGQLPLGYFNKQTSGVIKKTIAEDIDDLEIFVAHHLPDTAAAFGVALMVFVTLVVVDYRLACAAFFPLPFSLYLQARSKREYTRNAVSYHDNQEKMNSIIVEYIKGMPIIKTFNITVPTFHRFYRAVITHIELAREIVKRTTPYYALFKVGVESGIFFICAIGVYLLMTGEITISVFILFVLLGNSFAGPFQEISMTKSMLENLLEGADRISTILKTPPLEDGPRTITPSGSDIEFRQVSFSFGENQVLKEVSFTVREGTLCAFVGPSGAGKTTTALLTSRFWEPDSGDISIGDVPLQMIAQQELMGMISFVFQDVFLLNETILENIRMKNPEIDRESVIAAAKCARAHAFIEELEAGYDTEIGDGKAFLSGGEKQRIAVARAVAKNSPIVILDEATAFADPENEAGIQEALNELLKGRTVIVIAHKLSTIVHADQILVFEDGGVSGRGTHQELLETSGLYRQMWLEHQQANSWLLAGKEGNNV